MQTANVNLDRAEHAYNTFTIFLKTPKIKIFMAKVEKGRISFETVKVKTVGELLPNPFRK